MKFVKNTSKFLEIIDPFNTEIWSFMPFHGGFLIFGFRFMKPQTSFFLVMFFHMDINIAAEFLVYLLDITSPGTVLKTLFYWNSLNFTLF